MKGVEWYFHRGCTAQAAMGLHQTEVLRCVMPKWSPSVRRCPAPDVECFPKQHGDG